MANQSSAAAMPWSPAVPAGGRIKKRAGLPKLLHKLFIKVLRLRPPASAAFEACYRMGSDEEYCYYYSYHGDAGSSSWAGVLSSIPEEEVDTSSDSDEGSPDVVAAAATVLRKAKSERFVVGPPQAATVVHVEVLL